MKTYQNSNGRKGLTIIQAIFLIAMLALACHGAYTVFSKKTVRTGSEKTNPPQTTRFQEQPRGFLDTSKDPDFIAFKGQSWTIDKDKTGIYFLKSTVNSGVSEETILALKNQNGGSSYLLVHGGDNILTPGFLRAAVMLQKDENLTFVADGTTVETKLHVNKSGRLAAQVTTTLSKVP